MDLAPASVMARIASKHPRASEERVAALTVLFYEHLMGRQVRPRVPAGLPFPEEPVDTMLRELKSIAGEEYSIVRILLQQKA